MDPRLYFKILRIFKRNAASPYSSYFDQNDLLAELPSALRNEVLNCTHKKILNSLNFFKNKPLPFVMDILPNFTKTYLSQNEILYRKGDLVDEGNSQFILYIYIVFFTLKGRIGFVTEDGYLFRNFVAGSYFGYQEIHKNQSFRTSSVIAMEDTELLVIKKQQLLSILLKYPAIKQEMTVMATRRGTSNNIAINVTRKAGYKLETHK